MTRNLALALLLLALSAPLHARRENLALHPVSLPLPGAPSAIVPADVDGDGVLDLAVVVVYTLWTEVGIQETMEMDDVEGLVEVLTVIPSLADRRELRVFFGRPAGGFEAAGPALAIDPTVLSIEAGPPGTPVFALTDDGVSAVRVRRGQASQPENAIALEPLIRERPVLAGTGVFLPNLNLGHDVDADGRKDLLLPTAEGVSVYLSGPDGLRSEPASRVRFPLAALQAEGARSQLSRFYPLPEVRDVDGDRLPDLLLKHSAGEWNGFQVMRNRGGGRFGEAVAPAGPYKRASFASTETGPSILFFGDLDGDGRAEYVTQEEQKPAKETFRAEMEQAKRPKYLYRLHRSRPDLSQEPKSFQQFHGIGYAATGGGGGRDDGGGDEGSVGLEVSLPGGFQDLNGDSRLDLVAMSLDFSLFQAVKVLTVQRISIGFDFHVQCQGSGGGFKTVSGLDLSGKLNLNLNNMQIGQISQFAGDFDGDGLADFTQIGRGKTVTIHRGRADCSYPARPDLAIQLREPPRDLGLVQVRDFDGDSLADFLVIQPQMVREAGVTPPVRLDLYLSRGEA